MKANRHNLPVKEKYVAPSTPSGRFTALDSDKLRGGYYTSSAVAQWLCSWAIRTRNDSVLEPSCGDGAFVAAAANELKRLGATKTAISRQLCGIEIIGTEAQKAKKHLATLIGAGGTNCIHSADFFEWLDTFGHNCFDSVVGNPPFIRYQSFPERSRDRAMAMMARHGLTPNRLTNIWVPFVVAACTSLRPGGRLAMVLPAELLQVTYASQLRSFLVDRFDRIDIIACNELFFPGAEQEVVLLLADGALQKASEANTCRVALTEAKTANEIVDTPATIVLGKATPKAVRHDNEKWLKYFLSSSEITFMRKLRDSGICVPLSEHASVDVGVVTGKNSFFVLSQEQLAEHGLEEYVTPLVGRASHLRGALLTRTEWRALADDGQRVYLFHVDKSVNGSLSAAGKRYVRIGEKQQFDRGYKCSIREQWYSVPSVWEPDCFFFRQIYDFPRLVVNKARATSTDTIHRLTCKSNSNDVAASIYTHLTAASAEIEGRSYGGGVLELEPTESERLLMPEKLGGGLPIQECDRMIRAGRLQELLDENDRLILTQQLGLTKQETTTLREIWHKMRNRRMARAKRPRSVVKHDELE